MDSRVAILGANGAGKSTLLHLITGALQPVEGSVSKHSQLKLAKYSQHSADQLPYEKSPIEYFQSLFSEKYPEKDIMVSHFVLRSLFAFSSTFPLVYLDPFCRVPFCIPPWQFLYHYFYGVLYQLVYGVVALITDFSASKAWRSQLGRFGLSGHHQTSPIKQLSDGLRNRYGSNDFRLGPVVTEALSF